MFDKLRLEAARSMHIRDPMGAYQDELVVKEQTKPKTSPASHVVIDNGVKFPTIIFQGSKPQCEAFLEGIKYGAKAASADFASAF